MAGAKVGTSGGKAVQQRGQRWVLVAGGLVIVGLLAVLLAGGAAAPRLLGWGLRTTGARLAAAAPVQLAPHERLELRRAFECVARRAEAGELDEEQVGALSRAATAAVADGRLDEEELLHLRAMLAALCRPGPRR